VASGLLGNLITCLRCGGNKHRGTDQLMNLPKAESFNTMWTWFSVAVRHQSANARIWLASEFKEARFHYVRLQAEKGHAHAEYRLGLIFETGEHGIQSAAEAHKWFLRAAFHGIAAAQAKVSEYCSEGRTVPRNDEEAFKWCRKAAEQGHVLSQKRLAAMYRDGVGVERNPKEAKKWEDKVSTQKIPFSRAVDGELSAVTH
jgi:TPR repeat protein